MLTARQIASSSTETPGALLAMSAVVSFHCRRYRTYRFAKRCARSSSSIRPAPLLISLAYLYDLPAVLVESDTESPVRSAADHGRQERARCRRRVACRGSRFA